MRPIVNLIHMGYRVIGVGSTLFWIPPTETFHEFLIRFLKKVLTPEWYRVQRDAPEGERHVIAKWYASYCDWQKTHAADKNRVEGGWAVLPSGDVWAILTLGYDLYCLAHSLDLPEDLIQRLRNRDQFQGARYEVAVAATFARDDYKIDYLKSESDKSCEFIAKHEQTGEQVGVEVKSRHRHGVLHLRGDRQSIEEIKVGVAHLLNEAIQQKPSDLPFVISIDLNLPASQAPEPGDKIWFNDVKQALANLGETSKEKPEQFTVLFITNYSYHYESDQAINTGAYSADTLTIIPKFAKHPFRDPRTMKRLIAAINSYGDVPHDWNDHSKGDFMRMRTPRITTLLTCGGIEMNGPILRLQVGHTMISKTRSGTVDLGIYAEGHWFPPGLHELMIRILDEHGNIVSAPPPMEVTVPLNGVFEAKLVLENHIPFKVGEYEVHASIAGTETAVTQFFMVFRDNVDS